MSLLTPLLVLAIICLSPSVALATLVDRGSSTIDTETQFRWLDVSETAGLSYNQVIADYGGWMSAGWRHATGDEVETLISTYLGDPGISADAVRLAAAEEVISLLGATAVSDSFPIHKRVYGIYDDAATHPFEQFVGRGDIFYEESFAYSFWEISGDKEANFSSSGFVGHFLVKPVSVAEPGMISMLSVVMFVFGVGRLCLTTNQSTAS